MKVFKWIAPYDEKGHSNFKTAMNRAGVYIIKENGEIVYVGFSGKNLYRTLHRHFENWTHQLQEVVTYKSKMQRNKYSVRVIYCTAKQAAALEKKLILKYHPRDNSQLYEAYITDVATAPEKNYMDSVFGLYNESEAVPF